jgi:hypothetical protein
MRVVAALQRVDVSDELGDEVAIAMRSGARPYASALDPPPSRGKLCSVADARGNAVPQAPCSLTDGRFDTEFRPTACATPRCASEPAHDAAIVDLGRAVRVDLIVLRGCGDRCSVETSTNAASWRLAGVAAADPAAVTLASPRSARYVRVTGTSSVDRLTEISVWAGRPAVPDASLLVAPGSFPVDGGSKGGSPRAVTDGDDDLGAWPLVATGLLGAAAGGLLVALARRRRRAAG